VIKANPRRQERWFTIGALKLENGKIPGPVDTLVNKVELYVKRANRLSMGRRKRETDRRLVKREAASQPETAESLAQQSYGSRLRFECGAGRRFFDPDNNSGLIHNETDPYYDHRWLECNWNKTWSPVDTLHPCGWVQCLNPPAPPADSFLMLDWDGEPVAFNGSVSYRCQSDDTYFLSDNTVEEFNVTCLPGGVWEDPKEWPVCVDCEFTQSCLFSFKPDSLLSRKLHSASRQASGRDVGMGRGDLLRLICALHLRPLRQLPDPRRYPV
jgi:hypothetical protein